MLPKVNLMSSHSPEVAACAAVSPSVTYQPVCRSVTHCKASAGLWGVSVRVDIEKRKMFRTLNKIISSHWRLLHEKAHWKSQVLRPRTNLPLTLSRCQGCGGYEADCSKWRVLSITGIRVSMMSPWWLSAGQSSRMQLNAVNASF